MTALVVHSGLVDSRRVQRQHKLLNNPPSITSTHVTSVCKHKRCIRSQIFHSPIHAATPVAVSVCKCNTVWTLQLAPTVDDSGAQDLFAASVPATAVILSFFKVPSFNQDTIKCMNKCKKCSLQQVMALQIKKIKGLREK